MRATNSPSAEAALRRFERATSPRNRALVDATTVGNQPQVAGRRRAVAPGLSQPAAHGDRRAGRPATSPSARCSSASACSRALTLMTVVPLEQVWVEANFKETQLRQDAHRPAGRAACGSVRQGRRLTTAPSSAWAWARAAPSRCCRRRTPAATGSRSCSACRCASRSIRRQLAEPPAAPGPEHARRRRRSATRTARCSPTRRAAKPRADDRRLRASNSADADDAHRSQTRRRRRTSAARPSCADPTHRLPSHVRPTTDTRTPATASRRRPALFRPAANIGADARSASRSRRSCRCST